MQSTPDSIALTTVRWVQGAGAVGALMGLAWWALSLGAGNALGSFLLFMLGAVFVAPMVAWVLPAIALCAGLIAQVLTHIVRAIRSRSRA